MLFLNITFIFLMTIFSTSCDKTEDPPPTTITIEPYSPEKPPITGDPLVDAGASGDMLRFDFFGLLRDPALYSVTKEFGATVITNRKFPVVVSAVSAKTTPWSSWWFPKRETFLFEDSENSKAPLAKYDLIRRSRSPNALSAAEYEKNKYTTAALTWEGLCDAWAIASIARPEPKRAVKMMMSDGSKRVIEFSIADLKALLLKTYESVDGKGLKNYGQKFTGNISGWIYPDIFPEQFHRFIEVQLFKHQRPFVIDHDSGVEVWNIPVFRANYTMDLVPGEPDSVFVRTWIYSAEAVQSTEKSFIGTKQAVREYNYILIGTRDTNGNLVINSGYWVKGPSGIDSRNAHPDFLIQLDEPSKIQQRSWNPEIDINLVNEILAKSY